ncbi:hypothetical protein FVB32_08840 [Flagellimonas hymeniacidonis]|uniref:Lipoprotein n=1 Tax=Flagellimonas hymeniacidonis TaxID=2603628 RepID=A0A5C8VAG4_9FLAO|nr:hypothetical protein [Flagellimonas hymeniacidonis]TXN38383.1 hypothetical protein FVB32_08840 [Flagellimonas hymeniacidonis]
MKKIQVLALFLTIALTASCNFTEEIFLQEDGSGKLSINFDGSELMEMAGEEMMKSNEKAIDSLISFKDMLEEKKDSIAALPPEEQAKLKRLEPFNMHMVMNPEEKVMKFDLFSEFKNVSEVNDAFNAFQGASALGPNNGQAKSPPMGGQDATTEVQYAFSKNTFSRKAKIIDEELFQQSIDSLQGAEMFLSGSTYTLKYHFPRKVKSANVEGATFSADGKTLFYEIGFLDLMKNPAALDLQVELED